MTNSSTLFFICADITIDTFHQNVLKFDVGQNRVILNLYDKLKLFFLHIFRINLLLLFILNNAFPLVKNA